LILATINPGRHKFLFTKTFIKHKSLGYFGDRKYARIDKIDITEKSIKIHYNSELVIHDFKDYDEKVRVIDFLKPKMGDKLIVIG
jgi:hypothetical protein